jgi:hypothetical protein
MAQNNLLHMLPFGVQMVFFIGDLNEDVSAYFNINTAFG